MPRLGSRLEQNSSIQALRSFKGHRSIQILTLVLQGLNILQGTLRCPRSIQALTLIVYLAVLIDHVLQGESEIPLKSMQALQDQELSALPSRTGPSGIDYCPTA